MDHGRAQDAFVGHFGDVLEELCKYFPVTAVGVESRKSSEDARKTAARLQLGIHETDSDADVAAMLSSRTFRYLFIASFGVILGSNTIGRVTKVINFHMGLLPGCRGRHPLPAAILHGHSRMGVTAHIIADERIDAGPVIGSVGFPIDYEARYSDNESRLRAAIPELVKKTAHMHATGWKGLAEPEGVSAYYPPLAHDELDTILTASSLTAFKT